MIKALITILFFSTATLSYAEKLEVDTVKEFKSDNSINNLDQEEITTFEWFGFGIYAGSWYMLHKNKDLIDNSYAHIRLEKPTFDYLKRLKIMKGCSLFGIAIGALIILSSDINKYLKRQ